MTTGLSIPDRRLPEWSEALVERGLAQEAIQLLDRALGSRPEDPELRVALAQANWSAGDAERTVEATQAALAVVRSDDVRSSLLAMRALAELHSGRADEAVVTATDAHRIARDHHLPLFAFSLALSATGRPDEARAIAERLRDEHPALPHGHIALAASSSAIRELEDHVRRSLEIAPDDEQLLLWLGAVLLDQGRDREALDVLSYASSQHPGSERARQLTLRAASTRKARTRALLFFVLWLTGSLVTSLSDRFRWLGWATLVVSVLIAVAERRQRKIRLGSAVDGVIARNLRRGFKGTGALIVQGVGAFIAVMVVLWAAILAVPASDEGWATIHWWHYLIAGLIGAGGVWMLWKGHQVRRLGPSLVGAFMWRCRCRDVGLLWGGDVLRYTAHHLQRTGDLGLFPDAYFCPITGSVWIRYSVRLSRAFRTERLVRVSFEDRSLVEALPPPA